MDSLMDQVHSVRNAKYVIPRLHPKKHNFRNHDLKEKISVRQENRGNFFVTVHGVKCGKNRKIGIVVLEANDVK